MSILIHFVSYEMGLQWKVLSRINKPKMHYTDNIKQYLKTGGIRLHMYYQSLYLSDVHVLQAY